jgi:hypothetical protein
MGSGAVSGISRLPDEGEVPVNDRGSSDLFRALDGRLLFLHAKTAGYVAAAELRHQLAARLGIEHGPVARGIASILGVPRAIVDEFSTRHREIAEATEALGVTSAAARQVAAYDTRSAKEGAFDFEDVTRWWGERMDAHGFGREALDEVLGRLDGPGVVTGPQLDDLNRQLLRVAGITENEARFDRRNVVQAIAEFAGERLSGDAVDELADRFLSLDEVVRLDSSRNTSDRDIIRRDDGTAVVVPLDGHYTTRAMLAVEGRAISLYLAGLGTGAGVVTPSILESVFSEDRFARLSDEQREFVIALTTSGHRVQAAVGRAGSGKTTSLEAAVAAWTDEGYKVIGSAVGGTQAVLLGEEATGDARTVASILASYFDYDNTDLIDDRTVIVVDEASLVSTHDAALLERAVAENPGSKLVFVGDQEQHSSVAAGGFFRWVIEEHPDDVPKLSTVYRQQGEAMSEVRLALDEYREGMITQALDRLALDGRITEAASVDEAYDLLSCAWYSEHQRRILDPDRKISSMTAEHHHQRRELNLRARALLQADGTLNGPELVIDGAGFQVNDLVITRAGDHDLRAEGAPRTHWVRNGSRGVVSEVAEDHLVVDFERWGRVTVPVSFIDQEVKGVRGALAHSYALTTFAAQGATMATATPLITDASSREGAYVGLTRPQFDLAAVVIRYDKIVPAVVDDPLPIVQSELFDLEATARSLERDNRERLASQVDPLAARVNQLATSLTLDRLGSLSPASARDSALYERAIGERTRIVGLRGIVDPASEVRAHLGPRPADPDQRRAWDAAAGAVAIYREREALASTDPEGDDVTWALGPRPENADAATEYDRFADIVHAAAAAGNTSPAPFAEEPRDIDPARPYEDLSDDEIIESQNAITHSRRSSAANLEHLGRGLEVLHQLIDERTAAGIDADDLRADLERASAELDIAERDYRVLLDALDAVSGEAALRGLSQLPPPDGPTSSDVEVNREPYPDPVAPDRAPSIEI